MVPEIGERRLRPDRVSITQQGTDAVPAEGGGKDANCEILFAAADGGFVSEAVLDLPPLTLKKIAENGGRRC